VSANVTCYSEGVGGSCGSITGGIMYNDTTTSYKYINTTTDATPFYIVGEAIEPFTSFVYDNFNLSTQNFYALAYNGTYFWIGSGDGYVYRYTESGYDNWSFFVGGSIHGLDFNGTYFFVYNSTLAVYRYTANGVYDTTLFTASDDVAYNELDWYDNKIYMMGVNSKKIWIYYENGTKYNNITTSVVSGKGVATQNGIYLYVYDAGTYSAPDKRILVYKDLGYMNGGTYVGEWDISSDIGSGSAAGIKVVSNRLYAGTNPNPTYSPNRIKRYAHISNPSSIGTLNDGQSYLLNYTINVTDSPTKDYRLIFNFTSSLIPENDTQPAYIRISGADTTPPQYSLNSTNSTIAGTAVSHNLYWQDNVGLSGYSFAFDNCTGDFTPNDPMTYNSGFENVSYYGDAYSDAEGYRPYPWGFETWAGNPTAFTRVTVDKHSGNYSINMTGYSTNDVVVLAIPEYALKPDITVGQMYRMEAWIKLVNVQGNGVRLIQQWFNSTNIYYPEYVTYGNWYKGNSSWIKISLDSITTDSDNVKGDPIVELWGSGTVFVDDVKFYKVSGNKYIKEFTPTSSVYSGGGDYTSNIQYWDGSVVWMGANSWINVTSWGNSIPSNVFITDVVGYCGVNVSYGGILTFWTNYTGDIPFCVYDTNGAINQNFTCDLLAAGIDTPEKLNNLQMACKFDSAGNANLDWVHITAKYSYDWDAEEWVPFNGNPTSAWSNVTKVINSTVGCTIRWKVYANDTSNNWNASQEYSYITTSPVYISISLSPTLAGGITFGNLDPNSINVSSINCNNKQCNITVSSDTTVNVDIVVKVNAYLTRQGGTEIISTQYWNSSTTQQPVSPAYQFSTSYDYNYKVANNVPPNTNVIFNSWLTIPTGQTAGDYNNTIYFCADEYGTTNC
jgi:hypothetical protein